MPPILTVPAGAALLPEEPEEAGALLPEEPEEAGVLLPEAAGVLLDLLLHAAIMKTMHTAMNTAITFFISKNLLCLVFLMIAQTRGPRAAPCYTKEPRHFQARLLKVSFSVNP
jgi:hypothetical protein